MLIRYLYHFYIIQKQKLVYLYNVYLNSEMFSVGKDFRSMLGNIQYNETGKYIPNGFYFCTVFQSKLYWIIKSIFCIETGHIVSAGVTSLALYGQMNVSEADLNKKQKDVLGKQVNIPFLTENVRTNLNINFPKYFFSNILDIYWSTWWSNRWNWKFIYFHVRR